jgi:L-seryl-tRNA(Ser) seleniumtransferase
MTGIYERYGIRPIINARGTHTRLGGSLMEPEVLDAMREAAGSFVVLDELQERASEVIAQATGAEAGFVTGGSAAGLLVATAACVAGANPALVDQLPDTTGMKSEVIMFRAHRNGYDHSVRAAGVKIVEVGYGHGTLTYQLEAAFTERTALLVYLMSPWASRGGLPLRETCDIAHRHGVPVLVDGAAMLPPADNLRRFIADGADLVAFSGGKAIGGPQSSGILAGRADLIRAAQTHSSPHHSIGRTGKAAKEDIVGLLVALERYVARDHAAETARWRAQAQFMADRLAGLEGVEVAYRHDAWEHHTPRVEIVIAPETGIDAHELVVALEQGDPRVFLFEPNNRGARPNSLVINTHTMRGGEEQVVAEVLRSALVDRLPG